MQRRRRWYLVPVTLAAIASLVAVGFASAGSSGQKATKVTLQLKWVTQAQFAGFYAAKAKGFYSQAGLDVNLKVGGPDISPEQVVAGKQAEFGVDWLPSLLAQRDTGNDLVDIAQVFPRSGTTEVTWKSSGIDSFKKMKGKKFGVWILGNEFEQEAALVKFGLNPEKDVTIVKQNFDVVPFLKHEIDATSAMTYNELAQILEAKNPQTGKLYTLSDLNVFKMSKLGTGMLQDLIFVKGSWIKDKKHQATAVKFVEASLKGWIYCRDHWKDCVNITLRNGTALPRGHQTWQMNEINALIWPAPKGIGIMDPAAFARSAKIVKTYGKLSTLPGHESYRTDLAAAADKTLKAAGIDIYGKNWKKAAVTVTPGGK